MIDATAPTQTISVTFTRGEAFMFEADGSVAYEVLTDGPIRARGLLWVERADGDCRVIPADEYTNYLAAG